MSLADISIRLKLPLTIGAGLVLFASVVLLYTLTLRHTIARYEHLMAHDLQIRQAAQGITIHMLQARRAEKDFLLRKDAGLLSPFNQSVDLAIQEARTIEKLGQESREIVQRLVLVDHLQAYRDLFARIVSVWQAKGLDHQEGEQGSLRQKAHVLEEAMHAIENQGAMIHYLNMRRMEKDYLLRFAEAYVQGVEKKADALEQTIQHSQLSVEEKAHLQTQLADYRASFARLVALDRQLEENMARLRDTVHKVEPLAGEIETLAVNLAHETSVQTRQFAEDAAFWIFLVSVATIVACGMLSFYMVGSLVRAIGVLWRFAHDVASGNLEAKSTLSGADEIGQLAQVLREMVNRMRAIRLIADRMVMVMALIGRGAVPDEMEVEFHGDFQKISKALNEMIGRLRELRRIAEWLERIGAGEIPEKMTGEYHGDFKRIHDALNGLIDKLHRMGGLPSVAT